MRIVCISDTHGLHGELELPKGDMILHSGDFSKLGRSQEVKKFLSWYSDLDYQYRVFIAGNHDFLPEKDPDLFRSMIPANCLYLEDEGTNIEGISLWGSPYSPRFFDWAFNRDRGEKINWHWQKIPDSVDILLTHGPPYGILDRTVRGDLVGCVDLLKRIEELSSPKIHLFGHIHEAYGIYASDTCHYVNASVVDLRYQLVHPPIVLEWKDGAVQILKE
ncbi:MAG: metallophosphatase domain-containing protein [Bacteroidota bacterium]